MTVSKDKFVSAVENIRKNYSVTYKLGSSGQKVNGVWYCDCRGLILWALRTLGLSVSSIGSNWMIRNQMSEVGKVSSANQLEVGQVVFKSKTDTSGLNSRYKVGGANYDETIGPIDVYHVGVVVQTSPSLIIRHCSGGGIRTDTKIGAWNWAGWLKWVEKEPTQEDEDQIAIVTAATGKTVNLRSAPNKAAKVFVRVPIGSEVVVLSNDGTWAGVRYNNTIGYMMTAFLDMVRG